MYANRVTSWLLIGIVYLLTAAVHFLYEFLLQGEALASLCCVARVSLVTRCRAADFATRVVFNHKGEQVATEATAREVGEEAPLPVYRHPSISSHLEGKLANHRVLHLCMHMFACIQSTEGLGLATGIHMRMHCMDAWMHVRRWARV